MVIPPSLKLTELRTLATACGLGKSGTKDVLLERLTSAIETHRSLSVPIHKQRVLSIDLGVRNLAVALLTPEKADPPLPRGRRKTSKAVEWRVPPRAKIVGWHRTPLVGKVEFVDEKDPDTWGPAAMSEMALKLVRDQILQMKPTVVLLERQRFRSGGGAAVQEWTLRVNTLEAMIWACLKTFQDQKIWNGEIYSICPTRVATFWVERPDEEIETPETGKKLSRKTFIKKAKIDVAGNWLLSRDVFGPTRRGDVFHLINGFMNRWQKVKKTEDDSVPDTISIDKLDDLADSLLQCMAWIKWEQNKDSIADGGAMALLLQQEAPPAILKPLESRETSGKSLETGSEGA